MIFKLFSPSKVDEFAKSLAQDIAKRYPPAIANNPEQIVATGKYVLVTVKRGEFRPTPIPDEVREALAPYLELPV